MMTQITGMVMDVIRKNLMQQNEKGFRKYAETLDDVSLETFECEHCGAEKSAYDWNQMAMEELSDAMHYLMMENQRLKLQLEEGKGGMKFKEYHEMAVRTMPRLDWDGDTLQSANMNKSNYALGLNGEAGELGDLVKKIVHHGHTFDNEMRSKMVSEAGDVLHYLDGICYMFGITLDEVATMNIHKLNNRYPKGFSKEASINRKDEEIKVSIDRQLRNSTYGRIKIDDNKYVNIKKEE